MSLQLPATELKIMLKKQANNAHGSIICRLVANIAEGSIACSLVENNVQGSRPIMCSQLQIMPTTAVNKVVAQLSTKMAGAARAFHIVEPATVFNNVQISEEQVTFTQLNDAISDDFSMLQWAARRKLIRNSVTCTTCNQPAALNRYTQGTDGYRWRCSAHNFTHSVRSGSFFANSRLPIRKIIRFMYLWCHDLPQDFIMFELDMGEDSRHTVVDWANFMRDVCQEHLIRNPQEIGGFNDTGEPVIVEIDESLFFHRKYHRGAHHPGHWVFGGVERTTGRCFMMEVPDRRRETLEPIIERFILPGSHIISDGWPAYAHVENIRGGIYMHDVVVHERHFVDPDSPDVHTQNIENTWMRAKRKVKRQFGTSRNLFHTYIFEFLWRNKFRNRRSCFGDFLVSVSEIYVL